MTPLQIKIRPEQRPLKNLHLDGRQKNGVQVEFELFLCKKRAETNPTNRMTQTPFSIPFTVLQLIPWWGGIQKAPTWMKQTVLKVGLPQLNQAWVPTKNRRPHCDVAEGVGIAPSHRCAAWPSQLVTASSSKEEVARWQ